MPFARQLRTSPNRWPVHRPAKPKFRPPQRLRVIVVAVASLTAYFPFTARCQPALPHVAGKTDPWSSFIAEAAERFTIPEAWIRAVMRVESRGDVKAVSPRGAVGLMQIKPGTYAQLRERYDFGSDPADPHDNILAGAAYLREMYDRFGTPGFLAAYNAGPDRYLAHLATGQKLPDETRSYVALLTPLLSGMLSADSVVTAGDAPSWSKASLFVARSERKSANALLSLTPQPPHIKSDRNITELSALTPFRNGLFIGLSERPGKS